jgi:hypothetical protein
MRRSVVVVLAVAAVIGAFLLFRRPSLRGLKPVASAQQGVAPQESSGDRAPLPAFKPPPRYDDIETDPQAERYNPLTIAKIIGMQKLFDQEPRDPKWAPEMERKLGPPVISDVKFVGKAKAVEIECRTSTCQIRWDGDAKAGDRVMAMLSVVYLGSAISRTGRGAAVVSFWGSGPQTKFDARRPADELASMIITNRKPMLENLRSGQGRPVFYRVLQPSEWPAPEGSL